MSLCRARAPLLCLLATALATAASATPGFYTDRSSWLAAAGGSSFFEDFSGFATDTSFRDVPVAIAGGTIGQLGSDIFRNEIDVPPDYDFTEHNGTSHASVYTNAAGGSKPEIEVEIAFDDATLAFGFDHWVAADQEGARLEIYDGTSLLGFQDLSNDFGGFLGFVLDPGEVATSVRLRSVQSLTGGSDIGEGFGIDDLQGFAVPEPGTAGLLALGLTGLARRSRKRRL